MDKKALKNNHIAHSRENAKSFSSTMQMQPTQTLSPMGFHCKQGSSGGIVPFKKNGRSTAGRSPRGSPPGKPRTQKKTAPAEVVMLHQHTREMRRAETLQNQLILDSESAHRAPEMPRLSQISPPAQQPFPGGLPRPFTTKASPDRGPLIHA